MEKTTISNIETGITKECDIIYKNDKRLEVVIEKTTVKVVLMKNIPSQEFYIGKFSNMDFRSTGR